MSDATPSGVAAAASTPTAAELLRAVEHWRLVGLQQRKEAMDNEAMAISDQEDRSARARKQLAEKTKGGANRCQCDQVFFCFLFCCFLCFMHA